MERKRLGKVSTEGVIPVKTMNQERSNIPKEGQGICTGAPTPGRVTLK